MMHQPVTIAPAECSTCDAWVRWTRTGSGAFQRQELHEQKCTVYPRMQRKETQ